MAKTKAFQQQDPQGAGRQRARDPQRVGDGNVSARSAIAPGRKHARKSKKAELARIAAQTYKGATSLHGPHHSAYMSTRTGTSCSKNKKQVAAEVPARSIIQCVSSGVVNRVPHHKQLNGTAPSSKHGQRMKQWHAAKNYPPQPAQRSTGPGRERAGCHARGNGDRASGIQTQSALRVA